MRNIIVEGCDGSGKTGLIDRLMKEIPLVKHARASDSLSGPVTNLDTWVEMDLDYVGKWDDFEVRTPFIYDRHPLVSELIYADLRWQRQGLSGKFTNVEWILNAQRRMAAMSYLIICSPPYAEVDRIVREQGRDAHMPGVFENRLTLWKRYEAFVWPGTVIRYDRTRETMADLINTINLLEK